MAKIGYSSIFRHLKVISSICCFIFYLKAAYATSEAPFLKITKDGIYVYSEQTVSIESSPVEHGDMHEYVVVATFGSGASDSDKKLRFTTTYGKYEIYLIDLNGDNSLDVVTRKGVGAGVRARSEFFCFYIQHYDRFWEQLQLPASGYFARTPAGGHWRYELIFGEKVHGKKPVILSAENGNKEAPPITLMFDFSGFKIDTESYIGSHGNETED